MPRDGGAGTSNTGSAARRLFSEPEKFATALELDVKLIRDFRTIIIAHQDLNPDKFQEVCKRISNVYAKDFSWARPSSAIHKVLAHGSDLIRVSPLPLGVLSEEGAESKNKDYRNDRLHHARKSGRKQNLSDVFHRSMETSDPLVSMVSATKRRDACKTQPLPAEVQELLLEATPPAPTEVEEGQEAFDPLFELEEIELDGEDD